MKNRILIAILIAVLAVGLLAIEARDAKNSIELSVTERTGAFKCSPASSCTFFVNCKPGEILTGGGFELNEAGVGVLDIWASHPDIGKNRWRVTTMNKDTVTIEYIIYAMCAKIAN